MTQPVTERETDLAVCHYYFVEKFLSIAKPLDHFHEGQNQIVESLLTFTEIIVRLWREHDEDDPHGIFEYELVNEALPERLHEMTDYDTGTFPSADEFKTAAEKIIHPFFTKPEA